MQRLVKRAYQERAAKDAYYSRHHRVLVVLPGGSGKTIVIARIVQLARKQKKTVLIISHRREIIMQTKNMLARLREKPAILMGEESTKDPQPVTIASIATIMSRGIPDADILIIDECHRALAPTYRKVIARFNRKKARIIGLSATPHRYDGQALGNIFDKMIEAAKPSDLLGKYIAKPIMSQETPSNYRTWTGQSGKRRMTTIP